MPLWSFDRPNPGLSATRKLVNLAAHTKELVGDGYGQLLTFSSRPEPSLSYPATTKLSG
jgi:hypothetical protein